jgi:hypothetical protein
MRGQRGRVDLNKNVELDENFWARAAVDQAPGRALLGEGDESQSAIPIKQITAFLISAQLSTVDLFHSVHNFSMTTMTIILVLMMCLMATAMRWAFRRLMLTSRIS